MKQKKPSMGLSNFAEHVYARPAVAAACLEAQDVHGMDVNLLLYAAWLATGDEVFGAEAIDTAEARCRAWRESEILPRRARRRARRRALAANPARREAYEAAKTEELHAELRQLAILEELARAALKVTDPQHSALAESFDNLCEHYGAPAGTLCSLSMALENT